MKEPRRRPTARRKREEEGNVSWMRLCQSVTASADIALFVGWARSRSLWKEKGFEEVEEEGESKGGRRKDMHMPEWSGIRHVKGIAELLRIKFKDLRARA